MDFRDIEKAAREQAWTTKAIKKGVQFVPPDPQKAIVTWHGTPSDVRAIRNFLAQMKRSGLVWPWPPRKEGGGARD